MSAPVYRPIAATLLRSIFWWAALCFMFFAVAQSIYSYGHVKQEFQDEVNTIVSTNIPLLSLNLWDIEPAVVRRQIDLIATRPQIGCVRLTVVTGQRFAGGDASLLGHANVQSFDIAPPSGTGNALGRLEVCENPAAFYRELSRTVGLAALGYLMLTLVICAVIVTILKRQLELPLNHIVEFLGELSPQKLSKPLGLGRPPRHHRDEIDLMVDGFLVLQQEVEKHIRTLDEQVQQRTNELQSALMDIQRISSVDSLTQCLNRRGFDAQIAQEIDRAQRYGRPLSVVFGDVDHFKRINDVYGHFVGDQVLQAVADCLRKGVRADVDWIARFGGEEFVIIMPETDERGAVVSTERMRLAIGNAQLLPDDAALQVTASFGVAQYAQGESVESLVKRADAQMYAAKQAGRNCTFPA